MPSNEPEHVKQGPNLTKQKSIGSIYVYKNDPTETRKGVQVTNFTNYEGIYLPLLTDTGYNDRRYKKNNYQYDSKVDHGNRAMHDTTFKLMHGSTKNDYLTKHQLDYKGYQPYPEYLPTQRGDLFKSQFDLGESSNERSLSTTYSKNFYSKHEDKMYQLAREAKIKVYGNSNSTIKDSLVQDSNAPSYWTQYHRTHGVLGARLGGGETRPYANRPSYNILTGEEQSLPSWRASHNYNRVSGNSVLDSARSNDKGVIG